jgi:hypothetical protein
MQQGPSVPRPPYSVLSKKRWSINKLPAVTVRYRLGNEAEFETTFVVVESETFVISFNGMKPGRLETLATYPIYSQMLGSFKFKAP